MIIFSFPTHVSFLRLVRHHTFLRVISKNLWSRNTEKTCLIYLMRRNLGHYKNQTTRKVRSYRDIGTANIKPIMSFNMAEMKSQGSNQFVQRDFWLRGWQAR